MTAFLSAPADLYRRLRADQTNGTQVGFLLGDYDPGQRAFLLQDWRPVPSEGFDLQGDHHVALTDEMQSAIIKWAWDAGASLIETHSHGSIGTACFSPSDLCGLQEWVPHLWWRLRSRPYAAIVTAAATFDALTWIDAADQPEQVAYLEIVGERRLAATGRTLRRPDDVKS